MTGPNPKIRRRNTHHHPETGAEISEQAGWFSKVRSGEGSSGVQHESLQPGNREAIWTTAAGERRAKVGKCLQS